MSVSDFPTATTLDEKNDWLQSLRRVFRSLPLAERQQAIRLLQRDLSETDSRESPLETRKLPADHSAWEALDQFIREDRGAERAALDAPETTGIAADKQ